MLPLDARNNAPMPPHLPPTSPLHQVFPIEAIRLAALIGASLLALTRAAMEISSVCCHALCRTCSCRSKFIACATGL